MNAFNERLVKAMRSNDIEDIDQAAMFLRMQGFNYDLVFARFNEARKEAGMQPYDAREFEDLMQSCDSLDEYLA